MAKTPILLFANDKNAAALLDMKPAEFRGLMEDGVLPKPITQSGKPRRKPAFTKTEIKTYSRAAKEEGLAQWAVERTDKDGIITRFVCGTGAAEANASEWDNHEAR